MSKGLTDVYSVKLSNHNPCRIEYSPDDKGRWWHRFFERRSFGWREVEAAVPGGWQLAPSDVDPPKQWGTNLKLTRKKARLPVKAREGAELADKLLTECLGRRA